MSHISNKSKFFYISIISEVLPILQKASELLISVEPERFQELEITPKLRELKSDVELLCEYISDPTYKIVVYGQTSAGKSTLLNSFLHQRLLPQESTPTTGTAIVIRYGENIEVTIRLKSGEVINKQGQGETVQALNQYVQLNNRASITNDIDFVELKYPNNFLKENNVEFVDLPGSEHSEELNSFVRHKLLESDLIIQVLNAKKQLTNSDSNNLKEWLEGRGKRNFLFVLNKIDQVKENLEEVVERSRDDIDQYSSQLPDGVQNLYLLNALAALKARVNTSDPIEEIKQKEQKSGIIELETAISKMVSLQRPQIYAIRLQPITKMARVLQEELTKKALSIQSEISSVEKPFLLKKALKEHFRSLKAELSHKILMKSLSEKAKFPLMSEDGTVYQEKDGQVTSASKEFKKWETDELYQTLLERVRVLDKAVIEACTFFSKDKPDILSERIRNWIPTEIPKPILPEKPEGLDANILGLAFRDGLITAAFLPGSGMGISLAMGGAAFNAFDESSTTDKSPNKTLAAFAVGSAALTTWLSYLGMPILLGFGVAGGTVSGVLRSLIKSIKQSDYVDKLNQAYLQAISNYLQYVSIKALACIQEYEKTLDSLLNFLESPEEIEITKRRSQLQRLTDCIAELTDIESLTPDMLGDGRTQMEHILKTVSATKETATSKLNSFLKWYDNAFSE